jgi:phosphatidylserine/phosphatidylglycerophosphate/cardiolipin synthase-like enzyme
VRLLSPISMNGLKEIGGSQNEQWEFEGKRNEKSHSVFGFVLVVISPQYVSGLEEPIDCKVQVIFPRQANLAQAVAQELTRTRKELLLALYGFNNPILAGELVNLAKRQVKVGLKIDTAKSEGGKQGLVMDKLRAAGVKIHTVAAGGRNHNKFAVIDSSTIITGSYNWTTKADENFESLLIVHCPEVAKKYEREWDAIR